MVDTAAAKDHPPTKDTTTTTTTKAADAKDAKTSRGADEPTYALSDPRSHPDLEPGESRLVASGAPVPDGPKAATPQEQAERRDAGIPEPPVPGPGTDVYLTTAGYTTVPAGVDPNEPVVVRDSRMDPRQYDESGTKSEDPTAKDPRK